MKAQLALPLSLLAPRYWLTWCGVGCLVILAYCPWHWRQWLGARMGDLLFHYHPKRRRIVQTNLQLCFPQYSATECERLTHTHLREYANALLDYSVLFFRSRQWLYQRMRIVGREHLDNAIQAGHNVILMLGHSVWLEFAPAAIGQHYRAYGSYKPFKNPVIDWLIARSRLTDVEFVIPREAGMMKLVRALQPGRVMFFLPDEDHGLNASVFAPFFSHAKATLTTPARLSKLGKAVALPIMAFHDTKTGQYEIRIGAALPHYPSKDEIQDATQLNQALAELIRHDPLQYMWVLKVFRTTPPGEHDRY